MPRVVLFHGAGKAFETANVDLPEPVGAEVLVHVVCCTLCRSDLHTHAGRRVEATPAILGHEIVGSIAAFGPDAARVDGAGEPVGEGDRVTWAVAVGCGSCFFCANDLPQKCERLFKYGHHRASQERLLGGGLAAFSVLVPGAYWLRVPDIISDRVAALANCATATVAALFRAAGAIEGRSVLVLGAGALGLTACAMARANGAKVVLASDPAAECRERALAFGATHACPSDPAALAAHVHAVTDGRGADVVLELAGVAASVQVAFERVRTGGTVVLAGTVAPVGTIPFDPEQVIRRMLTIRGVHNYHPRDLKAALDFLAGPGATYPFDSLVAAEYPLDQVEEAFHFAHSHPGLRVAVKPVCVAEGNDAGEV